jgi:hypothetical protein
MSLPAYCFGTSLSNICALVELCSDRSEPCVKEENVSPPPLPSVIIPDRVLRRAVKAYVAEEVQQRADRTQPLSPPSAKHARRRVLALLGELLPSGSRGAAEHQTRPDKAEIDRLVQVCIRVYGMFIYTCACMWWMLKSSSCI